MASERCNGEVALVPAFNEEASIQAVVWRIQAQCPIADVVVINDGSQDRTAQTARDAGAAVLSLPVNLGMGGAMQTGYLYAAKRGYDVAIQIDGDGQHDPSQAGALIDVVRSGRADMAIGSRYLAQRRKGSSFPRRLGNAFLARYLSIVTRSRITDPTSGLRAVNRRVIEFYAREYPIDYPEPEAIAVPCPLSVLATEVAPIGGASACTGSPHEGAAMPTALQLTQEEREQYLRSASSTVRPERLIVEEQRTREATLGRVREAAAVLKGRFGARRVVLFGSLAHGGWFGPDSDVDLAVEGLPVARYWEAWRAVEEILPRGGVDLIELEASSESLRAAIARYGVEL